MAVWTNDCNSVDTVDQRKLIKNKESDNKTLLRQKSGGRGRWEKDMFDMTNSLLNNICNYFDIINIL